jgi:Thioredoxin-like
MGPMGLGMHADPSFQMMNALMEEQFIESAFSSPFQPVSAEAALDAAVMRANGALDMEEEKDDDDYAYNDDDDEEDNDMQGAIPPAPARLHDIFAAPTHLMHTAGGFQGAKEMAKDTRRWLLVNIQRDDEFSCHALNRDVWQNELVDNLIREGFIFWQQVRTIFEIHIFFFTVCSL